MTKGSTFGSELSFDMATCDGEQRYQRLLAAITDYIYSVDFNHGLTSTFHGAGCEPVTGYSSSEFVQDPYLWYRIIHDEDREVVLRQIERIRTNQAVKPIEHKIIHKDGSVRWIRNTTIPRLDREGHLLGYDGLITDITERKQAEERLWQVNQQLLIRGEILRKLVRKLNFSHRQLKETQLELIQAAKLESVGTLAAGVAHEVKNPLQMILLGLDYLGSRFADPDAELAATLADMREAVNRANTIIRELLSFATNSEFHTAMHDLNDLIARALLLVKVPLTESQIVVKPEFAAELPAVEVDPQKMEQVFINIFINSIQAMPGGGSLLIRTKRMSVEDVVPRCALCQKFKAGENLLVAEVQDSGPGLTEAELSRAFDPFFTTKPVGVGTGLGLSVARRIVEAHGGAIEIKNAPGGGALVAVALRI